MQTLRIYIICEHLKSAESFKKTMQLFSIIEKLILNFLRASRTMITNAKEIILYVNK